MSYPVGRSRFAAILLFATWLAGAAIVGAWAGASAIGWRQAVAAGALLAAGFVAAFSWLRSPRGRIAWDGTGWTWQAAGLAAVAGRPQLVMDWQSRVLLQWCGGDGRKRWLWLECKSDADHWDALRRAVYSRASTPVPPEGQPPVAEQ